MYSPQPLSKRPPAVLAYSGTRSKEASERRAPSFRSFVRQTPPPPNNVKPLPPDPPGHRTDRSTSRPRSRSRSSSVYSQLIDRWAATPESWTSKELDSDMFLPSPTEQSSRLFQKSTYLEGDLLPSSVYRPSDSAGNHDSGVEMQNAWIERELKQRKYASEDMEAEGMVTLRDAIYQPHTMTRPITSPRLESARMWTNISSHHSDRTASYTSSRHEAKATRTSTSAHSGIDDYLSDMRRVRPLPQMASHNPYQQHVSLAPKDSYGSFQSLEARGRTTDRSRTTPQSPTRYGPPSSAQPTRASPSEAERLAQMYHAVLRDESLRSHRSGTSEVSSASEDGRTRSRMKMVPQPLFHNPRQISEQRAKDFTNQRFLTPSPTADRRPGILKDTIRSRQKPTLTTPITKSAPYDLSPQSDPSDTPILGRFASTANVARKDSPHLHISPTKPPNKDHQYGGSNGGGGSTFAAMKDMFNNVSVGGGGGNKPLKRRLSVHVPQVVKDHQHLLRVAEVKTRLVENLVPERKRAREREERKRELKRIIRVIPNA